MIVVTLQHVPDGGWPGSLIAPAVGIYVLVAALLARANSAIYLRTVARSGADISRAVRTHERISRLTQFWLIVGLAWLMLMGFGRWISQDMQLAAVPLADKAVLLCPFLLAILLTWAGDYPFYRDTRARRGMAPGWTLRQYLSYNTRHHILFLIVPIGIIVFVSDGLSLYVAPILPESVSPYVLAGATFAATAVVFCLMPLVVVRLWETAALPAGPLRRRLEDLCRSLHLRYRDILIWKSRGVIANAAVLGLVGRFRFILLSDGLIEQLETEDIEAIFAHEAGHILHHHMLFAAIFTIAVAELCVLTVWAATLIFNLAEWTAELALLALLAGAWGAGFGWVSRRFERQSDVIGAWTVGRRAPGDDPDLITHVGAATFARALDKIGRLNGIPAGRKNWRHGSMTDRISYILWLGGSGRGRRQIDTVVRRIKIVTVALFFLASVLGAYYLVA